MHSGAQQGPALSAGWARLDAPKNDLLRCRVPHAVLRVGRVELCECVEYKKDGDGAIQRIAKPVNWLRPRL